MNPLNSRPQIRNALYIVQWLVNGVLTVAGAYFAIDGTGLDALPRWYVVALAVGPVLWTYLGLTASANVPGNGDPAPGQD